MENHDKQVLDEQPDVRIWSEKTEDFRDIKIYKGKFVQTEDGKFFAKIFPKSEWDGGSFFHDMVLEELGVKDAKSEAMMEMASGGGKIEIEWIDEGFVVRLWGKSSIYGEYDPTEIDSMALEEAILELFDVEEADVDIDTEDEE